MSQPAPAADPNPEPLDTGGGFRRYHAALVFLLGLGLRLWLIHAYPIVFGGDSIMRLANHDRVLLAYQLPLLQLGIHYISLISEDPLWIRYLMALIGATAGLGFYLMTKELLGPNAAFYTALIFVTNPFVLAYSIVPYQEILMLGGLFFGFYFFFKDNWLAASLFLGLACLTRYEAWAACPVFVLAFAVKRGTQPRDFLTGSFLFGWAPLGWLIWSVAAGPSGSFLLDTSVSPERLFRYVYLGWITVQNTAIPFLILAAIGLWRFFRQGMLRAARYRMLAGFLALFLIALLFSAHGERDQPDRFVTAREAHLLLASVTVMAGLGLSRLRRFRGIVLALGLAISLFMADRFVDRATSDPRLKLSYELAQHLDQAVSGSERVVVLAKPIAPAMLSRYLDKSEELGGIIGRRKAALALASLDTSPPDYQRTLVHSRLGKSRLRSLASLPLPEEDARLLAGKPGHEDRPPPETAPPDWLVVWSDFEPTNLEEARLGELAAAQQPQETLHEGSFSARIYRTK